MKDYFNIKEAAQLLGVSPLTLRNWDKKGMLVAYRNPINNYRAYKVAQVEKLLDEMENERRGKKFKIKVMLVKD
ncbi:MAG: helix-turn-helix domain-containing protein [bacterium]|nr:helix-turn-helix domain-containing protein [bacterium]